MRDLQPLCHRARQRRVVQITRTLLIFALLAGCAGTQSSSPVRVDAGAMSPETAPRHHRATHLTDRTLYRKRPLHLGASALQRKLPGRLSRDHSRAQREWLAIRYVSLLPPPVVDYDPALECPWEPLIRRTFPEDPDTAVLVAMRESNCDPRAVNSSSGAAGLMQLYGHQDLLDALGCPDAFDPYCNLLGARSLYDAHGWQPWSASL